MHLDSYSLFTIFRRYIMKSLKFLIIGAVAFFVMLACNFSSDVVDNSNTASNDNSLDSGSTDNETVLPATALTVSNNSGRTICSLYVAPQEITDWGDERLGTEVLGQGESQAIEVSDGSYRIRASDCDSNLIAEYNDVAVNGSTTLTVEEKTIGGTLVGGGEAGTLTIVNNSSEDVCYVYVSPADSTSWGDDWLDESTILDAGESETVTVGAGIYDLQAADCDGNAIAEQYDVDLSTGQTWTLE
jgi:hypothetical protein